MNGRVETHVRSAIPVWGRIPAAVGVAAGLVAAVRYRPAWPTWLWAATKPLPAEEIHLTIMFAAWVALVASLTAVGWVTALRPPLIEETIEHPPPPWIHPPREKYTPRGQPPGSELLEIFKKPSRRPLLTPIESHPEQTASPVPPIGPETPRPLLKHPSRGAPILRLYGPMRIEDDVSTPVRPPPARGLVAYLVLNPGPVPTDELQAALWPDEPIATTRQRFWKAKCQAQRLLGDAIVRLRDGYALDRARVRVEVDELEHELQHAAVTDLTGAVALGTGDALQNVDFPWVDTERRRFNALRIEYLRRTATALLESRDHTGALAAAERLIALDGFNERGWQLAMQAEGALGQRQAVIDRYEQLTRVLDETLGLRPGAQITDTYRRLLSQNGNEPDSTRE